MSRIEKPCVLLIDDNEPTRTLMTALLQRDYDVRLASDGIDAIEQLKVRPFAAVILDLRMPHLDGYGVLEFLQQHAPRMLDRVIVVTAALAPREIDRARSFGIREIVKKPFDVEALQALVRNVAGDDDGGLASVLRSSGPMLLLIANILRQRLL